MNRNPNSTPSSPPLSRRKSNKSSRPPWTKPTRSRCSWRKNNRKVGPPLLPSMLELNSPFFTIEKAT